MIKVVYPKTKRDCALCKEIIVRYTAAMFDAGKVKEKRYVHLTCWKELQRSRGIVLEEPPF